MLVSHLLIESTVKFIKASICSCCLHYYVAARATDWLVPCQHSYSLAFFAMCSSGLATTRVQLQGDTSCNFSKSCTELLDIRWYTMVSVTQSSP